MEIRDLLPGIVGSFVGVMGWLLVGLYIQRRQFMRPTRSSMRRPTAGDHGAGNRTRQRICR